MKIHGIDEAQGRSCNSFAEHAGVALRAFCGAANVLSITRQFVPEGCSPARADLYEAWAGLLPEAFLIKAALATIEDEPDDLVRALQALAGAVQDYIADKEP